VQGSTEGKKPVSGGRMGKFFGKTAIRRSVQGEGEGTACFREHVQWGKETQG